MVLIDQRAPSQRLAFNDRPIIYSSETLTLCGSPPPSPTPIRSPLRPPQPARPRFPAPPPSSSPLPMAQTSQFQHVTSRPGSTPQLAARREPNEAPVIVKSNGKEETNSGSNEKNELIQEMNSRLEALAQEAALARAEAQVSRDAETEWRIRALESEASISQKVSSQRSNLVGELKAEAALWRTKFSEVSKYNNRIISNKGGGFQWYSY